MFIDEVLSSLDEAFNINDLDKADNILKTAIETAASAEDSGALLQLLNEYIGFLRSMSRYDEAREVAGQIRSLLDAMGLEGSIPYATSYLNIATALRAGGYYDEALTHYNVAESVYLASLPADSMLFASFYNNKSLLFQDIGDIDASIECLNLALKIAALNHETFEMAVSHANLANSYAGISDYDNAYSNAHTAIKLFDEAGISDSHYASALYIAGVCEKNKSNPVKARDYLEKALQIMEINLGKNEFYYRILDELKSCQNSSSFVHGIDISRAYYEKLFKPVIDEQFADYVNRIAVGLVGRGSDCYKYDDEASMDHDWGPGFLVWVTHETYEEIGERLTAAYNALPDEFMGFRRGRTVSGHKRRGVFVIEDFYKELLGTWPVTDYSVIPDYSLSAAVNGEVFTDPEGLFTDIRNSLKLGYPMDLLYLKIAEAASRFSQAVQYNVPRMINRGDTLTANILLADGIKQALKLYIYLSGQYPPHDKWLVKAAEDLDTAGEFMPLIRLTMETGNADALAQYFANTMYRLDYISDIDDYLDHHAEELVYKSALCPLSDRELVKKIVALEFEAFDKVDNEGGRADCQDDWMTFSKMRMSQYLTWTRPMLMQYLYDFDREFRRGHNLITEKYGRMMASTAPDKYARIKDNFPAISEDKEAVIEAVVAIQVGWMEEFAKHYPRLSDRARSIHSFEDTPYNTSYETYLRGEIQTYSDKMLQMYAGFITDKLSSEKNLAYEIMHNNVKLYGYESLDTAEEKA